MEREKKKIRTRICNRCGKEYESINTKKSRVCPDCNKVKPLYNTKINFMYKGTAYKILKILYNSVASNRELKILTKSMYYNITETTKLLFKLSLIKFKKQKAPTRKTVKYFSLTKKGRIVWENLKKIEKGLKES